MCHCKTEVDRSTKAILLAVMFLAPGIAVAQSTDPLHNSVYFVEDFSTFFAPVGRFRMVGRTGRHRTAAGLRPTCR